MVCFLPRNIPHIRRFLVVLSIISVLSGSSALLFAPNVYAHYVLEGGRWQNQPTSGCCADFYVHYETFLYAQDKQGFDDGRTVWNQTPTANIYFYTTSSCCVLDASDTYDTSIGYAGWTVFYPCKACQYYTQVGSVLDYANIFPLGGEARDFQATAAHELGHAVGLDHDPICGNLMYVGVGACGVYTPQADDIDGVNHLY